MKKRIQEFNDKAKWLRSGVLYHRGKHNKDIKENTMEAFRLAVEDKLGIELDARITKDFKVVVSHDSNLKRVFGKDLEVEDCSYEEIKNYVPLLEDVLNLVCDQVGVMVEIKSKHVGKLEKKVCDILNRYKGRCVVVSFNPFSLRYFKKKCPSIIRGQLSCSYENSKQNKLLKML